MKPRMSSVLIGLVGALLGAIVAHALPRFASIFHEICPPESPLPVVTQIILGITPAGWLALGALFAGIVLLKDLHPRTRGIPNWPFVLALVLVMALAVVGCWLPLIVMLDHIG